MTVNVAMISHGRPRLLAQALESLYANTDRKEFNLTVVSDGENETGGDFRCTKLLRRYAENETNMALIEVSNSGHILAQLKNLAVFWSRQRFGCGDFLHLGDSDVCFLPGWLKSLISIATLSESHGYRLWGGQIHPFHAPINNPFEIVEFDIPSPSTLTKGQQLAGTSTAIMTEHSILDGPSWFMRWGTWREFGPLNRVNAPGPCQSEEFPFCDKLTKRTFLSVSIQGSKCVTETLWRIGVPIKHCVIHTGLTNSNGELAPGAEERRAVIPPGVYAE